MGGTGRTWRWKPAGCSKTKLSKKIPEMGVNVVWYRPHAVRHGKNPWTFFESQNWFCVDTFKITSKLSTFCYIISTFLSCKFLWIDIMQYYNARVFPIDCMKSFFLYSIHPFSRRRLGSAGASPSFHRTKVGKHPGQVAYSSQGHTTNNHSLSLTRIRSI